MTYKEYLLKNNFKVSIDHSSFNYNQLRNILMQKYFNNNLILYITQIKENYYHIIIHNAKLKNNSIIYNNYKNINDNNFVLNYNNIFRYLKLKNII